MVGMLCVLWDVSKVLVAEVVGIDMDVETWLDEGWKEEELVSKISLDENDDDSCEFLVTDVDEE